MKSVDPRDDGVVIAITAIILVALVAVIATLIHYTYLSSTQTELQSAADAAALSAAGRLNSGKSGWADSRDAAIKSLSRLSALAGVGDDQSLMIDADNEMPRWDLSAERNLIVRIERGFWSPGENGGAHAFESWEGDWQKDHPGIPHLAANAVRVILERPRTHIMGSPYGGILNYSVQATSIALRGAPEPVCVAPFALPVCALLNDSGDFQGSEVCKGDRLFTRADRYCPKDISPADCEEKTLPSSPYTLVGPVYPAGDGLAFTINSMTDLAYSDLKDGLVNFYTAPRTTPIFPFTFVGHKWSNYYCSGAYGKNEWVRQEALPAVTAHYGLIGLPGDEFSGDDELHAAVLSVLTDNASACAEAKIGDRFTVLASGLTSEGDGDAIWSVLNRTDLEEHSTTSSHLEYAQTLLGSIETHVETVATDVSLSAGPPKLNFCPNLSRHRGVCNSRRGRYVLRPPAVRSFFGVNYALFSFELNPTISDASPVWKVKIPIIAEPGSDAPSCRGMSIPPAPAPHKDPAIDTSRKYIIVGFVDLVVYDVDIGLPPPDYPIQKVDGTGMEAFPEPLRFQQACDNIRARVTCESQIIPSSNPAGYASPRLVTAPNDED